MRAIRIFFRSIRDSFKSIVRNFSLSIASILCVTITLILVSFSMIASANINYTTELLISELSIIVYLDKDITEERIKELDSEINNIDKVSEVEFKSKDEWKAEMSEYDPAFETILNYLEDNPLHDSFTVKVDDIRDLEDVADYLTETNNINTVKYGGDMINDIVDAFDVIQNVTIGVVIALILVTTFLIGNTIKLTIYSRKSEIEIMRLVGASNIAIKLPFIFEGLLVGIIGSIIPVSLSVYAYIILHDFFGGSLFNGQISLIDPFNFIFMVSGALLLIGAFVGMLGSLRAVRKHLKV